MNIAVFTKTEMCGGSEIRGVELCNAIARHTPHQAYLLSERGIPRQLQERLDAAVKSLSNVFVEGGNTPILYEMDSIVVINTDSKQFTTIDYWQGRSKRHQCWVDLGRIRQLTFLFNFIVSPAQHLWQIEELCKDVRIIVANMRFLNEIATDDRYIRVRHLPRMMLESPIDPTTVCTEKNASACVRIGKHSHAVDGKFNEEHFQLIERVNTRHRQAIEWDFMGVPQAREHELVSIPNVTCRSVFSLPVLEYLKGVHIFLFFISWKRQEPWARSIAEAMMSGCPILATDTDGGNRVQVLHGSNGYLCRSVNEFADRLCELIENPARLAMMGRNSRIYSRTFTSEEVIRRLLNFLGQCDGCI